MAQKIQEAQPLRELGSDELENLLDEHEKWVKSVGKAGARAELSYTNLRDKSLKKRVLTQAVLIGADLSHADLRGAFLVNAQLRSSNMVKCQLQGAWLVRANFQGAFLYGAQFDGAHCYGADFREAKLTDSDFTNTDLESANFQDCRLQGVQLSTAKGLLPHQIAGADLAGAEISEKLAKFEALAPVEESSKNSRKIFFSMILGCVYSWLTLATTQDVDLLTNSSSSPLPIINTAIPIVGFYTAAPIVLLALFVYFHLYLNHLWKGLAGLPAIFPDGRPLNEHAYPWLLIALVQIHLVRLRQHHTTISYIQNGVSIMLAWLLVPLTLVWFWARQIVRHDTTLTIFLLGLIFLAVLSGWLFFQLMKRTLHHRENTNQRSSLRALISTVVLVGVGLGCCSYGAIMGAPTRAGKVRAEYMVFDPKLWAPSLFESFGWRTYADVRGTAVSIVRTRISSMTGDSTQIMGADLSRSNLRFMLADGAYFESGDFRGADVTGMVARGANLKGANFTEVDLRGVDLTGAHLEQANLQRARLDSAAIGGARFKGANLDETNFTHSIIVGSAENPMIWMETVGATDGQVNLVDLEALKMTYPVANFLGADLSRTNGVTAWGLRNSWTDLSTRFPLGIEKSW